MPPAGQTHSMPAPTIRNRAFRALLRIALLAIAWGLASHQQHSPRALLWLGSGLLLLLLALAAAVLALRASVEVPPLVRLFGPSPSTLGRVAHVLSFFTFADPGEVSWHAVEAQPPPPRSIPMAWLGSLFLFSILALPATMLLDWLLPGLAPRFTLSALVYLWPWLIIRGLEILARARLAAT